MEKPRKSGTRVAITAAIWAATYISCLLIIKKMAPEPITGIILSFLPGITFAIFLYSWIKIAAGMDDEVQIRIQLEAVVIAFSLGLLMIMTLGLLDLVIILNKEDWGYRHLIPYYAIFYLIGLLISRRKYN